MYFNNKLSLSEQNQSRPTTESKLTAELQERNTADTISYTPARPALLVQEKLMLNASMRPLDDPAVNVREYSDSRPSERDGE